MPGRNILIRQLCETYDRGERPSLTRGDNDVHSVASLLKCYLRELPEPLIPFAAYESVMRIITREKEVIGEENTVVKLNQILISGLLSPSSYNTLHYVCRFLAQVASHAEINKMTAVNLATVFVQSFIRPELDDPNLMLATSMQRTVAAQVSMYVYPALYKGKYLYVKIPITKCCLF